MSASRGGVASRTTSPVASSVSVSAPNVIDASYTFGSPSTYGMSRVPRPTRTTRRPVANGSSVPVCPTRCDPTTRRTIATTSCDVTPGGLSTSSKPPTSVVGVSIGRRRNGPLFDLREEILDVRGVGDALVRLEGDFGREPQAQRLTNARPQKAADARESLERLGAFGVGPHDADEDLRMSQISRHLDAGDGNEARDARI